MCLSSAGRSSHLNAGSSDMLGVTGIGEKLSDFLRAVLIQVAVQALIDPTDFSVSIHALNLTVLNTLIN